jgi:prepilin-type processing-associated H-X9-DG protein
VNLKQRLSVIAAGSVAILGIAAGTPASAATASADSVHRGSVGCFNYSWADGSATYTIYYHNTCTVKSAIAGTTNAVFNNKWCANVAADGKGHTVVYNKPLTFASARGGSC